jgi:iron complex transport system permease protein
VRTIVWSLRLPQALMALLVGAALGLAGGEMQTVLNNPLADPFTLGVSTAAALGAAVAIILGMSLPGVPADWILPANAFIVALGALLLLRALAGDGGVEILVLFGIALGFALGALLSLAQFLASADALQQLVFWGMGSLGRAGWHNVAVLAAIVGLVAPFSLGSARAMTALRLGEERAASLGVDLGRLRLFSLLRISLLAAGATAFAGIIGFVGLAGPHIARVLAGEAHRFFLPVSILTGMAVMSFAAIAAKLLVPGVVIPIGIVTALVGLPVFFVLIQARRSKT